jgi:uncharacterized membrane protein
MDKREWLLKRNCSLSPRQFVISYVVLCLMTSMVTAHFVWHGAWIVLLFALLELSAVALAFLHYARHALDHEHIALADGCLLVEQVEAGRTRQIRLDPCRTRISAPQRPQDLICLQANGMHIEVGRFVTAPKRSQLAQELQRNLSSSCLTH